MATVRVHPNDLFMSDTTAHTDNPRTTYNIKKCCKFSCNCSVVTLIVLLIIILSITISLDRVSTHVKDLEVLEIDSLTASNFNLSSDHNQISANWNIQMKFKTRDKHGYYKFTKIKVSVYYNDKRIALTGFRSFQLSSKNPPMHFGGEFLGSSGYVDDSVIRNVRQGIMTGNVKLDVLFKASVIKTSIERLKLRDSNHYVGYCENLELVFESRNVSKAWLNGSHTCRLYKIDDSFRRSYNYSDLPYYFRTTGQEIICVYSN